MRFSLDCCQILLSELDASSQRSKQTAIRKSADTRRMRVCVPDGSKHMHFPCRLFRRIQHELFPHSAVGCLLAYARDGHDSGDDPSRSHLSQAARFQCHFLYFASLDSVYHRDKPCNIRHNSSCADMQCCLAAQSVLFRHGFSWFEVCVVSIFEPLNGS